MRTRTENFAYGLNRWYLVANDKKYLKRVQTRVEEILTASVVLEWLKEDAVERAAKKSLKLRDPVHSSGKMSSTRNLKIL